MSTKRSHILRQGYLKNFTDSGTKKGKIFCYDLENNKFASNEGVTTKGFGWRPRTYSVWNKDKSCYEDAIEKRFGKIEGTLSTGLDGILKKLKPGKNSWSSEDDICIASLVALVITKVVGEKMISNKGVIDEVESRIKDVFNEISTKSAGSRFDFKEEMDVIKDKLHTVNHVKELFSDFFSPNIKETLKQAILQKDWLFISNSGSDVEFCVSDFPLYFWPNTSSIYDFMIKENVELIVPLSKNRTVVISGGFDKKRQFFIPSSSEKLSPLIEMINKAIIANAKRYIAGSNKLLVKYYVKHKLSDSYPSNFISSGDDILKSLKQKSTT